MRTVRHILLVVGAAAVAATWIASSIQLANGVLDLLVFTAPGAVIGLLLGWLSHAFARRTFTWTTGLASALAGGVILAPWLAALIVLASMVQPGGLLMLFTVGAWVAVLAGLAAALLLYLARLLRRPTTQWKTTRPSTASGCASPPSSGRGSPSARTCADGVAGASAWKAGSPTR